MRPTALLLSAGVGLVGTSALALSPGHDHQHPFNAREAAPVVRHRATSRSLSALAALEARGARVDGVLWKAGGFARTLRGRLATSPAEASPSDVAADFLRANRGLLGLPEVDGFRHVEDVRHIMGTTVRFRRTHQGVPVEPGSIVVQLDRSGEVRWYTGEFDVSPMPAEVRFTLDGQGAIAAALSHIQPKGELRAPPTARQVVSTRDGKATEITEVMIAANEPLGDWLVEVGAGGEIVAVENRLAFASARVFRPNAVVVMQNPGLQDGNDSADAVPAEAYETVELQGLDDSGMLTGPYVSTENTSNRVSSDTGEFHYDRSQKGFEEAMLYYHLDFAQRYFQELGFDNVNNRVQRVDAHGTTQDNSWYSPATKDLTFGDGGVDDAEDAEVIWHEYGHSTHDNQVPGWGSGGHARAMGEAFGDYLGGAVSQKMSDFQLKCVADWDGVSYSNLDPPCLRRLDVDKHYPEDLGNGVHADGEIWSGALWPIHVGFEDPDDAVRLVLAHHFLLGTGATMPEAAEALLAADQQLYAGAHKSLIKSVMVTRGILESTSEVTISLTSGGSPIGGVATLTGASEVTLEIPADTGTISQLVAPGSYTLSVRSFGYLPPESRSFEVEEDQVHSESFELAPAPTAELAGTVKNQEGAGLAATVSFVGVPVDPVQADGDGHFSVQVPEGSYDLLVSAFGYKSAAISGVTVPNSALEVVLEPVPPILVVDDDGDEDYEQYFEAALADLGMGDQYMKVSGATLQAAADLLPFETVIWFCGNRYNNIFPESQQAAIRDYLAAGGRFLVSGQDIGYGIKSTPFYKDVFGSSYVKDTAGSKHVLGAGLDFHLGGDSADNQSYPDVIAADGGTLWLNYEGDEGAAMLHTVGEGRVVYLGFGLEGVDGAESRKALMGAMLEASDPSGGRRRGLAADWFGR